MPGIARQDTFQTPFGIIRSVRDHDHAGMLRIADADTAAVVNGNPRCAAPQY